MGKAVEDSGIFAQLLNCQTIVFLIKEKSGLLSVLYINKILHAIFLDLYVGVELLGEKALDPFHTFIEPYLRITPLIDTADLDAVLTKLLLQQIDNFQLKPVNSKCQ